MSVKKRLAKEKVSNSFIGRQIQNFLTFHQINLGHSEHTVKAYEFDLRYLFTIIEDEMLAEILSDKYKNLPSKERDEMVKRGVEGHDYEMDDIKQDHLYQLIRILSTERKNSNRTIGRKMHSFKSFYLYLEENGLVKENTAKKIKLPKIGEKELKRPSATQVKKLFDYLKERPFRNEFEKKAFLLYFRVKFSTMARRIEMTRIQVKDIHFEENTIKLWGKGNKERVVDVDAETLRQCNEFIKMAQLGEEDYLIRNYKNKPITPRALNKRVDTVIREAELPSWITTHLMRKASASIARENGVPLEILQLNLGHKDIKTTQLYVITDEKRKHKEMLEKHPTNILTDS